jgi:molybdopterin-synthase adenylyltransferase
MNPTLHESLYRGSEALTHFATTKVVLCGVGALGSHLADHLARQGFRSLKVIDRDRVEEHNVSTQLYGLNEVGGWKTEVLKNRIFRTTGIEIETINKEVIEKNAESFLKKADLVVDLFDNSISRSIVQNATRKLQVPCLHVGLFIDYAEVIWDEQYRVPEQTEQDVCEYPLARNIILLAISVASETLIRFVLEKIRPNWSITLRDFRIAGYDFDQPTKVGREGGEISDSSTL